VSYDAVKLHLFFLVLVHQIIVSCQFHGKEAEEQKVHIPQLLKKTVLA
jgi:hypothetical protein